MKIYGSHKDRIGISSKKIFLSFLIIKINIEANTAIIPPHQMKMLPKAEMVPLVAEE